MSEFRYTDEEIDHYTKTVEVSDTGMVTASVFANAEDGHQVRRVGLKFFGNPFTSLKSRLKKAHIWADEHAETCQNGEVQKEKIQ